MTMPSPDPPLPHTDMPRTDTPRATTESRTMHANDPSMSPDDRFDAAMRARHAAALDALSPRVAAQLQQRRRAALAGRAAQATGWRRVGWPVGAAVAASFAALFAVGIALQSPSGMSPAGGAPSGVDAGSDIAAADAMVDADGDGIADDSILDEDPDFYAWLASSDATALAME